MSIVTRCDWCGEEAHPDAPIVELRTVTVANADNCTTTAGWVGHYHAGRWRNTDGQIQHRNCFDDMHQKLRLIHEYAPAALESTPVLSNQKLAQLRRKHQTTTDRDAA